MDPIIQKVKKGYGVFVNLSLTIPTLIGEKSNKKAQEYFIQNTILIRKGFDLIPNELKIRLINQDDISVLKRMPFNNELTRMGNSIVEWTFCDEKDFVTKYNLIFKTQLALRLLKDEPLYLKKVYIHGGKRLGWVSTPSLPTLANEIGLRSYDLYPEDIDDLKKYVESLNEIDFKKERTFRITCHRFERTYYEDDFEDELIDLCIGFEAFYLKGSKGKRFRGNRGLKTANRCAKYIGIDEEDQSKIIENVVRGFQLRNDIVHGSEYEINEVRAKVNQMNELLRKSIIKHLNISPGPAA